MIFPQHFAFIYDHNSQFTWEFTAFFDPLVCVCVCEHKNRFSIFILHWGGRGKKRKRKQHEKAQFYHVNKAIQLNCRFIAVCHPISSPRFRTPLVSKVVSVIAWCISVILMSPIILYSWTIDRGDGKMSCNIVWPSSATSGNSSSSSEDAAAFDSDGSTFTLYTFTLGFAIPLCLILIFYYLVLRKLRTVGPKTKSKEKKRSHRKVTKLVLTVITVYILCWSPYWVSCHFIFLFIFHSSSDEIFFKKFILFNLKLHFFSSLQITTQFMLSLSRFFPTLS